MPWPTFLRTLTRALIACLTGACASQELRPLASIRSCPVLPVDLTEGIEGPAFQDVERPNLMAPYKAQLAQGDGYYALADKLTLKARKIAPTIVAAVEEAWDEMRAGIPERCGGEMVE